MFWSLLTTTLSATALLVPNRFKSSTNPPPSPPISAVEVVIRILGFSNVVFSVEGSFFRRKISTCISKSSTKIYHFFLTCLVLMLWFCCGFKYVRGDRGFCSVECRSKQMVMDEEESFRRENCSFMAVKATKPDSPAPTSSGLGGGHHRHRHRRDPRN